MINQYTAMYSLLFVLISSFPRTKLKSSLEFKKSMIISPSDSSIQFELSSRASAAVSLSSYI
jgi:hypothetical protein